MIEKVEKDIEGKNKYMEIDKQLQAEKKVIVFVYRNM